MAKTPIRTPTSTAYVTYEQQFQQLQQNFDTTKLAATGVDTTQASPIVRLDGCGRAYLQGDVTISSGSPSTNMALLNLPANLIPTKDYYFPVTLFRSGTIEDGFYAKLTSEGSSISAVTITAPGSYTTLPTAGTLGAGTGATFTLHMKALTATVVTPQSSTGSYAPGDHLAVSGGTETTAAAINVISTQLQSATINAAGTGGTPGTATLTGTTGTGTKFQVSATISGGGTLASIDSITVHGNYTVNPTSLTAEPVTGGGLTGATLTLKMGALNATILTAGDYTALPTNPVATTATTGSGTGATFNLTWGALSCAVLTGGSGYNSQSSFILSGGGGTGGGAGALTLDASTTGLLSLVQQPTNGDVIKLDGCNFFVESYS